MFKWYTEGYPGTLPGEKPFPISSVIEGALVLPDPKDNMAHIVTYELEQQGRYLECAISDQVRTLFEKARVTQDYGLIILQPGEDDRLKNSTVLDFISFHRHPTRYTPRPTGSRYGISDYTKQFEKMVLGEGPPSHQQKYSYTPAKIGER